MRYSDKKKSEEPIYIYCRIKNLDELIVGGEYHLRKTIEIVDRSVKDEVHDIKLKAVEGDFVIDELTENKYKIGKDEFEIFFKRPMFNK